MTSDGLNRSAVAALDRARLDGTLDRANGDVVLIVADVPDNLSALHDALDESGYTVLALTTTSPNPSSPRRCWPA